MKIDLNMSDPLTLGLTMGIGHPVTERIRRITMRQTNKYMLSGTVMIIAAGLGLSSTALSTEASEPIKDAVKTVLESVEVPSLPSPEATQKQLPKDETQIIPKALPQTQQKLAEAPSTQPVVQSAAVTGLRPMRLRFTPRFTTEQLEKIEAQRQAYAAAKDDKLLKAALDDTLKKRSYKNRFQVTIDDFGVGGMKISLGQGGWPAYSKTNKGWLNRNLSADMQGGLKDIIKRCASELGPVYYYSDITEGDADIGKGTFEVECTPGSEDIHKNTSRTDLAYAYLNSEDLPLDRRQNDFQWMIGFAMMYEYVKNTPNATLADDRAACIRMNTERKNKHAFTENHRQQADHFLGECAEKDYNWVRKRLNIPEIQ